MAKPIVSGTVIGGFRILELLGRGGMGEVFRAQQLSLNRVVAFKVLRADEPWTDEDTSRFRREGRIQSRLSHPNLVRVHDFGEEDGQLYIAMELVQGESLADRLRRAGALPLSPLLRVAREAAAGLVHLHEKGVRHRDFKPDNILLDGRGHAKLSDFGLSRRREDTLLTAENSVVGTLPYLAPEVFLSGTMDERSDVYSLGIVIYQMASNRLPYDGDARKVMAAHMGEEPARLSESADVPPELDQLVWDMTRRDPAVRPTSRQVLDRLGEDSLSSLVQPIDASDLPPPRAAPMAPPPAGRYSFLTGLVAGGLAVGLIMAFLRPAASPPTDATTSPTASAPASHPPSPVPAWMQRMDRLLTRYEERLSMLSPRPWLVNYQDDRPSLRLQHRFWKRLAAPGSVGNEQGVSAWFPVFEPANVREMKVTITWEAKESFGATCLINGKVLEGDPSNLSVPPDMLERGLNHLWMGPFSPKQAASVRVVLDEIRLQPIRRAPLLELGCVEEDFVQAHLSWLGEIYAGQWNAAGEQSERLQKLFPGQPCASWQTAYTRCLIARVLRDSEVTSVTGGFATHILPIADVNPETAVEDLATSVREVHRLIDDPHVDGQAWRILAEALSVNADVDIAWDLLTYAVLRSPELPDTYFDFYIIYEGESLVQPRIRARKAEVVEFLQMVLEMPQSHSPAMKRLRTMAVSGLELLNGKR